MITKAKQGVAWILIFVAAIVFLELAITGRLAILVSIAFLPDNVAYLGNG